MAVLEELDRLPALLDHVRDTLWYHLEEPHGWIGVSLPCTGGAIVRPAIWSADALISAWCARITERMPGKLKAIRVAPAHIDIMRSLVNTLGQSQQAVAEQFCVNPSYLVTLVDDLERQGFVEHRRNQQDRRLSALYPGLNANVQAISRSAAAHQQDISAALSPEERTQLKELLTRIARQ